MPGALDGRVAVVTGASSGIGEATAEALAREGATVAVAARRLDRLEELAKRISDEGGRAETFEVDVADEDQARGLILDSEEKLGGLDILINNAGLMLLGPVQGADTEGWRRMVDVNCLGLLYCTHAALPVMQHRGGGHIVNVSSVAGRQADLGSAVYNMTKWGVVGFSEALRQEALHSNIRVTVVEPGFVATELHGHNELPVVVEGVEKMRSQIGDVLAAEDIADAIT
jgi:clavulanate-9-aldehyde reducatase